MCVKHSTMSNVQATARSQDLVTITVMSILGLTACVNAQSALFWGVASSAYQVGVQPYTA